MIAKSSRTGTIKLLRMVFSSSESLSSAVKILAASFCVAAINVAAARRALMVSRQNFNHGQIAPRKGRNGSHNVGPDSGWGVGGMGDAEIGAALSCGESGPDFMTEKMQTK